MRFFRSYWFKVPAYIMLGSFALIGFFLSASYFAITMKWTNESGIIDVNNRYFYEIKDKYNQSFRKVNSKLQFDQYEALQRIILLNKFFPKNAQYVLNAYQKNDNQNEVLRMLDAADLMLKNNRLYQRERSKLQFSLKNHQNTYKNESIYEWMNISEWETFKTAVCKDKRLIDSVANQTGVEARLIVSCLVGEQIRLFNSNREAYKKWIGPLKILSVESQFSFGVTGIKEPTAIRIENLLKDSVSVFYLGREYEHLLDFKTADVAKERMDRLTSYRNHYYSYLYAALFLKQVNLQWQRAGFSIADRPEILATLFNVGFPQSLPKKYPKVGGSLITINEKSYSFGAIAFQFYYSGELYDQFPFEVRKFDWNEIHV